MTPGSLACCEELKGQDPNWPDTGKLHEVLRPVLAGGWWPLGLTIFGEKSLSILCETFC